MPPPWPPGQGPNSGPDPNFGARIALGPYSNNVFGDGTGADWFTPNWQPTTEKFEELSIWVMNQKPAHVHALGDMFVRAAQLLRELESNVRARSMSLFSEQWTRGEARDSFMVKGPGQLLAYLQDWATQQAWNIDAMYDLVEPIQKSQTDMQALINRHGPEVKAAGTATVSDNMELGQKIEYGGTSVSTARRELDETLAARETAKREEFDRAAREIVRVLAGAYANEFNKMTRGVGAPYVEPNVIMASPGQQWPSIPAVGAPNISGPGVGAPNVAKPPTAPNVTAPNVQRLATTAPNVTAPVLQEVPTARTVTTVPTAPQVPAPTVGPPPGAPVLPPIPGGPGVGGRNIPSALTAPNINGVPGAGAFDPRTMPTGLTAPNINAVPGAGAGVTAPGVNPGMMPPGAGRGVSRGVLGRPGQAPGGVLPPPGAGLGRRGSTFGRQRPGVRSPAADYTGTGAVGARGAQTPGVMPPPGVGTGRRQGPGMPVTRSGGPGAVPDAFNSGSMPPPVAPVLGRQNRGGQPGQHGLYTGPQGGRGAFAPPSATPPVLNAQSRAGGSMLPPPASLTQQHRRRAAGREGLGGPGGLGAPGGGTPVPPGGFAAGRRTAGRYTGQPAPNLVGNPDWLAETTQESAPSTAPVLRNQMATPEPGALPPMMPPMPGANAPVIRQAPGARPAPARGTAAAQGGRPGAARPARSGPSEAELARRSREAQHQPEARPGEDAAFTVQTPGGPVVGSTPARPEEAPRPTVGNT